MSVGRGISGHGFWNRNHLVSDLVHLLIIIKYFETSFHYQKLQFVPFFPKSWCKKKKRGGECYAKILYLTIQRTSFLGVFLLKEQSAFLCVFLYWLIRLWSWFMPELQLRWVKWWLSGLDSWEALFCTHCPLRMVSLGWLFIPGLLERWGLRVWISRKEIFPFISHIHLRHRIPEGNNGALFCGRLKIKSQGTWLYHVT